MENVNLFITKFREALTREHRELAARLIKPPCPLYYPDMFIIAGLKRSLSHLRGFADLVQSNNYFCAAPIVRIQLDNALRTHAMTIATDPSDFSVAVLEGGRIDKMKDRSGNRMIDSYLAESLSAQWPWVKGIYEQGSGYVHFSGLHMTATFRAADGTPVDWFGITDEAETVPADVYHAAANAIANCTRLFLVQSEWWIQYKDKYIKPDEPTNLETASISDKKVPFEP